ncbi:MAG: respiratory nitrate reductase subunit gamma, partial [Alphaproteobacteria bacterium]|nr:respiratory nitrate reductase subunit gamma [Alphaproteobacteria bacterium]
VFKLQPDISMIVGVPLVNKLHLIVALLFFAYLPFTKLVHIFSYPFGYIARPFISMRKYVALKK